MFFNMIDIYYSDKLKQQKILSQWWHRALYNSSILGCYTSQIKVNCCISRSSYILSDSLKVMNALIVVVLDLWLWRCLCSFIDMVYWHVVTCSDCMSFSLHDPKKCLNVRHMLCVLAKERNCQITYITSLDKGNEHCGIAVQILLYCNFPVLLLAQTYYMSAKALLGTFPLDWRVNHRFMPISFYNTILSPINFNVTTV